MYKEKLKDDIFRKYNIDKKYYEQAEVLGVPFNQFWLIIRFYKGYVLLRGDADLLKMEHIILQLPDYEFSSDFALEQLEIKGYKNKLGDKNIYVNKDQRYITLHVQKLPDDEISKLINDCLLILDSLCLLI